MARPRKDKTQKQPPAQPVAAAPVPTATPAPVVPLSFLLNPMKRF